MIMIKNIMTGTIAIQQELTKFEEEQLANKIADYMISLNVIGDIEVKKEGEKDGREAGIGGLLS